MSVLELLTAATLIVLIFYTVETYRLRKTAEAQVDSATRPTVMFDFDVAGIHYVPVLRNVGCGPAFNVSIEGLDLGLISLNLKNVCVLGAEQSEGIPTWFVKEQKSVEHTPIYATHFPCSSDYTGRITYNSASGVAYRTFFVVSFDKEHNATVTMKRVERVG